MYRNPGSRKDPRQAETGAVLILVILVLALISVLVMSWAQEWRTELQLAANFREAHQCRRLAEAGIYYTLGKMITEKVQETSRTAPGTMPGTPVQATGWQGDQRPHLLELPGGWARIRVADEGGKINLNRAPEEILSNLFSALGVPPARVRVMVDSILDWRSAGDIPRPFGAKSDYYLSLNPPYVAKNRYFEVVEELAWVRGFQDSPLIPRLWQWFTVQGVSMGVNVNTAPLPVLQAMGLAPEVCQTIIATRQTMPFRNFQEISQLSTDPRVAQTLIFTFRSSPFFTIESTGMVNKNRGRYIIKALVRLDFSSGTPGDIISWQENFPG